MSTTCRETLLGELGWFKLQARRDIRKLIYWYHLMTLDNNRIIKKIYLIKVIMENQKFIALQVVGELKLRYFEKVWTARTFR